MRKSNLNTLLGNALRGLGLLTLVLGTAHANDNWYPSKYGAEDTIGALNELSPTKTKQAAELVKLGKTYALGVENRPGLTGLCPAHIQRDRTSVGRRHGNPHGQ
jgi:hypothetical protein